MGSCWVKMKMAATHPSVIFFEQLNVLVAGFWNLRLLIFLLKKQCWTRICTERRKRAGTFFLYLFCDGYFCRMEIIPPSGRVLDVLSPGYPHQQAASVNCQALSLRLCPSFSISAPLLPPLCLPYLPWRLFSLCHCCLWSSLFRSISVSSPI